MESRPATRVLILDDHLAFAEALALALSTTEEFVCVATTASSDEAGRLVRGGQTDIVISDQHLSSGESGIGLLRSLRSDDIDIPMLLLTGFVTPRALGDAAALGVAVISKATPVFDILTALRQLRDGQAPDASATLPPSALTASESKVLERLGNGDRATDIAASLHLSIHTVRDHIKAILRKLDASSQLEAVAEAQRQGLLAPPN